MYCLLRSRFSHGLLSFSFMLYRVVVLCNSEVPIDRKEISFFDNNSSRRPLRTASMRCPPQLTRILVSVPKYIQPMYVRVFIMPLSLPAPVGCPWLSLALVPWSIKKPNRTDWLTRVLPTSHPQSDMNILASLRFSNAYYCATTTSFLPYVIRVVRDVMDHGTARGRFSLGRLLACFALVRTWLALLYLSSNYSQA
jgi:hypothetical protein